MICFAYNVYAMKIIAVMVLLVLFNVSTLQAQIGEETVVLETGSGNIEGTLLVPETTEGIPVALIIAGSGPTDRDGNNPMMKNNSLKMVAEGLSENGIATLRYDKRGIGASQAIGLEEKDLRFEDYIKDAKAWVKKLKNDKRFSEIIIVGHSEGSLIGMIAVNKDITKFISLSGSGLTAGDLIKQQISAKAPILSDQVADIVAKLENEKTVDSVPPMLFSLFRPSVQPYMISWMKYDPAEEIAKLNIPILVVQGTTDLQVDVAQAEKLASANPKVELEIIDGMNHILKEAPSDPQENIKTYTDPDLSLKEGVVDKLSSFIKN